MTSKKLKKRKTIDLSKRCSVRSVSKQNLPFPKPKLLSRPLNQLRNAKSVCRPSAICLLSKSKRRERKNWVNSKRR